MAEPGAIIDPYRAYSFKIEIRGVVEAHFTTCKGLGVTIDVIKYREGGLRQIVRHIPGQVNNEPVAMGYGVTSSKDLVNWLRTAIEGNVERRNISILMLNPEGVNEVLRWNLSNAWVASWRGAVLDAMSREVAIESVTLVYDRLEWA